MPLWLCLTTDLLGNCCSSLGCYVVCTAVASVCLFPDCVPADRNDLPGLIARLLTLLTGGREMYMYARVHDGIYPS